MPSQPVRPPDPVLARLPEGITLRRDGRHAEARALDRAREHLDQGLRAAVALPAGEYGDVVRDGLDDLARRLGSASDLERRRQG